MPACAGGRFRQPWMDDSFVGCLLTRYLSVHWWMMSIRHEASLVLAPRSSCQTSSLNKFGDLPCFEIIYLPKEPCASTGKSLVLRCEKREAHCKPESFSGGYGFTVRGRR
jgi:hypothetical protein